MTDVKIIDREKIEAAERRGYAEFINGGLLSDCPMENSQEKSAWWIGFNLSASIPHGVLL